MQSLQTAISFLIPLLVLVSNILFVLAVILFFSENKFKNSVVSFVEKHILSTIFVISLGAVLGSLSYSDVIGFVPCDLCWFQRIAMYPQVLLSFMAILRKDLRMISYLLPLSVIGSCIAFYHSLVQWGIGGGLLGCTTVGGECVKVYVSKYGYITIPFMAFSAFAYLIVISLIYLRFQNVRES